MVKCIVNPSHTYRTPEGLFGAGDIVYLPLEEARKQRGALHFEEPPQDKQIEVEEE